MGRFRYEWIPHFVPERIDHPFLKTLIWKQFREKCDHVDQVRENTSQSHFPGPGFSVKDGVVPEKMLIGTQGIWASDGYMVYKVDERSGSFSDLAAPSFRFLQGFDWKAPQSPWFVKIKIFFDIDANKVANWSFLSFLPQMFGYWIQTKSQNSLDFSQTTFRRASLYHNWPRLNILLFCHSGLDPESSSFSKTCVPGCRIKSGMTSSGLFTRP